jgi:hypothetical protein
MKQTVNNNKKEKEGDTRNDVSFMKETQEA